MKYIKKFNVYFMFIFIFIFNLSSLANLIEEDKYRWEIFYKKIKPDTCVKQWFLPFKTKNRSDVNTIKVISTFGAKRYSYFKGHIHTGIDIIPEKKSSYKFINVYPMAKGKGKNRFILLNNKNSSRSL